MLNAFIDAKRVGLSKSKGLTIRGIPIVLEN